MSRMPNTHASPDDLATLKSLLAEQAARAESLACINTELQRENERIKAQVLTLREQLHIAIAINGS